MSKQKNPLLDNIENIQQIQADLKKLGSILEPSDAVLRYEERLERLKKTLQTAAALDNPYIEKGYIRISVPSNHNYRIIRTNKTDNNN